MDTISDTESVLAEQAFNDITRAIADNATNALFLMNVDGVCTFLNPSAEEMFGFKLFELQDKPLHDYIHYIHPDGRSFPVEDCPIGHSVFSLQNLKCYEDTFIRKNGGFIPVRCSAKTLTKNDKLTGILLEVQDITEEKKAAQVIKDSEERYRIIAANLEQLVNERTAELQRSNNDLLQFAHVASHDLKEPVRKILFFANRIQEDAAPKLNEAEKTYVSKVIKAGERLKTMIEGVLQYSTTNSEEQNIEAVDLNHLIQDITEDVEILMLNKGAVIINEGLPTIEGSSILLYQLFYNLINNSLKFSNPDKAPKITLLSTPKPEATGILVVDNGIGFHEAYAEKIFEPFTRLNNKDAYEGTGLGLALCKKIVQRHGGTIEATNNENGGSCFRINLPLLQTRKAI